MKKDLISLLIVVGLALGVSQGARWWLDQRDGAALRGVVRAGDIQMISSLNCSFCARARAWMDAQGISYSECFVERDADCARRYEALGARGTPTLLVRGQVILGFDRTRLLAVLTPR